VKKPDSAFFERAAAFTELPPKAHLFLLDDTLENVTAAKAAGWNAVHWHRRVKTERVLSAYDLHC
jgi:HAD superfamily hydrolase (TIGR01509 family)